MASLVDRAQAAMDQLDLMMSIADPNKSKIQLNKSQCTYLYKIIKETFAINFTPPDSSPQQDSESHREENNDNRYPQSPESQLDNFANLRSPGGEALEPHDNKKLATSRELCFAIERAQVLANRCCNKNVLEAAILQTDLTEEILTLVSFFSMSDIVEQSDCMARNCKVDGHALQKLLEAKKEELQEQEQGILAAYLLERLYHDNNNDQSTQSTQPRLQVESTSNSINVEKDNNYPTRRNNWYVDPSKLGSAGQRLGKDASGYIYETTWLGAKFTRKFFLGTNNPRFEAEASSLVDLRHLNIVHTFCWAKDIRSYSLVQEIFGTDLHTYVQKKKELERKIIVARQNLSQQQPQQYSPTPAAILLHKNNHLAPFGDEKWLLPAVRIMLQIAAGMKYLHEKGVAHGDLEPNNILVKPVVNQLETSHHLHVKVADFGLMRTRWYRAQYSGQEGKERAAVGFQWKAPEQLIESPTNDPSLQETHSLDDEEPSAKKIQLAEVYTFATLCLYIYAGGLPVKESESNSGQALYELPHGSCWPNALKDLLRRCWTEMPNERPSFAEICETLRDIHSELMPKFKKADLLEPSLKRSSQGNHTNRSSHKRLKGEKKSSSKY